MFVTDISCLDKSVKKMVIKNEDQPAYRTNIWALKFLGRQI